MTPNMSENLQTILSALTSEYSLDLYLPNYQSTLWVNLSDKNKLIYDTIETYKQNHQALNHSKIYNLHEEFSMLINYDEIISFKHAFIYKELYKILYLIDSTIEIQSLLNDSSTYPYGFAEIQSDMKEVKARRRHYKMNLIGDTQLRKKGESRLKYWMMTLYFKNRELFKFFLHIFIINDLEKINIDEEKEEDIELIFETLIYFLTQKTTINAVIKSLGILLYWEMRHFLKMNHKESEVITQNIIYKLFNQDINMYEFNKHITIKSSIGFYPIFSASKKEVLNEDEKAYIQRKLLKELKGLIPSIELDIAPFFDSFIGNSHIQYLQKYPVEFFRINPKYSS
ncbi:hypothetical protein [uncultured Sulfuricurvum sp.]|uniref:hypothetical protein n=1 Tax=uncultured Sulfuricurvum sp. TaxID=430693 RepID=UPI002637D4B4|nr:hypothetical protein [uncultured Sulfuricurvum sp.]